jgi:hypothetical protein
LQFILLHFYSFLMFYKKKKVIKLIIEFHIRIIEQWISYTVFVVV